MKTAQDLIDFLLTIDPDTPIQRESEDGPMDIESVDVIDGIAVID